MYLIKITNITADRDMTFIGQKFRCGMDTTPYTSLSSAESALSRQKKQDEEYCPDCLIKYEIIRADKAERSL